MVTALARRPIATGAHIFAGVFAVVSWRQISVFEQNRDGWRNRVIVISPHHRRSLVEYEVVNFRFAHHHRAGQTLRPAPTLTGSGIDREFIT